MMRAAKVIESASLRICGGERFGGIDLCINNASVLSTTSRAMAGALPPWRSASSTTLLAQGRAAVSSRRLSISSHLVPTSLVLAFCGLKSVRLALLPVPLCARVKLLPPGGCWETA